MTILELKRHFKSELSPHYSESESALIFRLLAERVIGFDSFQLRRFQNQEVLLQDLEELQMQLNELKTGRPVQHLLGNVEFYGQEFSVSDKVLIPRPETEELLEIVLEKIATNYGLQSSFAAMDIGTGSGVIPIIIKKKFPNAKVVAVDYSYEAIEVAKKNALDNQTQIEFMHGDYLEMKLVRSIDVLISNPPYIGIDEKNELSETVVNFEPSMALFSPTSDALIFYRKIAIDAQLHLNPKGFVFLEINQKYGPQTLALFDPQIFHAELVKDLSGNDRFIIAQKI